MVYLDCNFRCPLCDSHIVQVVKLTENPHEKASWGFSLFTFGYPMVRLTKEKKMANKEQKSNAKTKKEPKLNLKEKRLAKQEKKSKKD